MSFLDFLNSLPAPASLLSLLRLGREFPPKWSQITPNIRPNLPMTSLVAHRKSQSPYCGLSGFTRSGLVPLPTYPCCSPSARHTLIECHEYMPDTLPPQGLCMYCSHHQECSFPQIYTRLTLTAPSDLLSKMTFSPRPSLVSLFKIATSLYFP